MGLPQDSKVTAIVLLNSARSWLSCWYLFYVSSDLPDLSIPLRSYLLINNSVSKQVPEKPYKHIPKWEVTAMYPGCIGSRLHFALHLSAAQAVADYFSGTHFTCVCDDSPNHISMKTLSVTSDSYNPRHLHFPESLVTWHCLRHAYLPQKVECWCLGVVFRKYPFYFVLDDSHHCWTVYAHFKSYCLLPQFIREKENAGCQNRLIY